MKRLLLIMSLVLMTLVLSAQKKSNYEKYWQAREDSLNKTTATAKPEYDDLYYQPSKDAQKVKKNKRTDVDQVVDTLVKDNPDIQVNYYYNDDPFLYSYNIGRFYHGGFNYWMYTDPWYYSNWMYDPYDWYWDMRFSGYPYWAYPYYNQFYFGFGYNYWNPWRFNYGWGHNWYGNHNWYTHNNWSNGGGNYHRPEYGHRETGSALSNHRTVPPVTPQNRSLYNESRRSYSPSYNNPRMSTRPQYNNSRLGEMSNRRTQISTQTSTFNRTPNTQVRTQSRTYQQQNYKVPSRSYSPPANRNSEPQGFGRTFNFNAGDERRSSGSSNFSSGSSSSSSGRSSSGGSSGRR